MEEFLRQEAMSGRLKDGKLPPNNDTKLFGKNLWDYLSTVSDFEPEWNNAILAIP
eukprot:CAMPEP_0114369246 /NCGR_PEP_ID=MMETSP0101-20121206/31522_1 /TAXON_ID=38822 ORGANISM="Pteridomonas danica, Strain PT" /NCGR_SAMPLE_ID=MMETSP0101 /ASSEMBLY_ACC=CAM_ASM_000211 /LENGTH=54 /DNA_ID=CAMNT_0001519991 /DNA_START=63 /DNA_END=224 /DNA_ORIENTATION=+